MSQHGENQKAWLHPSGNGGFRWLAGLSPKFIVLQLAALLLLAGATVWLLERGDNINAASRKATQDRSLTELVALAVGSEVTFEDSARFLRILEVIVREGQLLAGAVLDKEGVVVAHTDISRAGIEIGPQALGGAYRIISIEELEELRQSIFGSPKGQLVLHPMIDASGLVGTVVLLLPEPQSGLLTASSLKLMIPAALLLLAFVGLTQSTIRQAMKPTADFLGQLAGTLPTEAAARPEGLPAEEYGRIMEQTVSHVSELTAAREALIIENRVLDYDRKRKDWVLDHLPDGILVVDPTGKIVSINLAAASILRVPSEQFVGQDLTSLPASIIALLQEAEQSGHSMEASLGDGAGRQVVLSRIPLRHGPDENAGTLFTLRDVSAQQAALRAQGEFLSQISHELKAPLNTILAYVDALADDTLLSQDERKEYSNTLSNEAQRMARLISNLLQMSRIQLGNLNAQFGFVKTSTLITSLAESVRSQAVNRKQTYEVRVPENLPALYGDKDLLGVAITNLITNAIKYTPESGRVSVEATEIDGAVNVEIRDTGIGIKPADQELIFERFARSSDEEVQQMSGTGLGLALVKEIAEIHDGEIEVESEVGRGSLFRLHLPCREVGGRLDLGAAA